MKSCFPFLLVARVKRRNSLPLVVRRKSQKPFKYVKMAEKDGGESIALLSRNTNRPVP